MHKGAWVLLLLLSSLVVLLYVLLHQPEDLPGPRDTVSARSKEEFDTKLQENPYIVGGWIFRRNFEKTENPFFYYWAREPSINEIIRNYDVFQKSGRGYSSAEFTLLQNIDEARIGKIRCVPIDTTVILTTTPNYPRRLKELCVATLPPFKLEKEANLAIAVVTVVDSLSPAILDVHRTLLELQVDIYNRDYMGHETWIAPAVPIQPRGKNIP